MREALEKSTAVILQYQTPSGAYPASPTYLYYQHSWLRDGSFTADAMSRAGEVESAERFFAWAANVVVDRREHILNGQLLDARYNYDGKDTTGDWGSYQLDGYGTLLWVMKQHEKRHGRSIEAYQEAAGLIQHYLATHWSEPNFDWWEEQKGIHPATLACIYAGLEAYNHPEAPSVKAAIRLEGVRTDASLLICPLVDAVSDQDFAPLLEKIEHELTTEKGGVYRYRHDEYFGGGEWPVTTGLLGWYYAKLGRTTDAKAKLEWLGARMQENGWLPEQTQEHLQIPGKYTEWVSKVGEPANPLLWSQAAFITLADETGML